MAKRVSWGRIAPVAVAVAGVCAALAAPPSARADAVVSGSSGVSVSVLPRSDAPDGQHGIVVEPFKDGPRVGLRVKQDGLGRPPFTTFDSQNCVANPVFNDVVCTVGSLQSVLGGDENDVVIADERVNGQNPPVDVNPFDPLVPTGGSCVELGFTADGTPAGAPVETFSADLGAGDDVARLVDSDPCPAGLVPEAGHNGRLAIKGAAGGDSMEGSPLNDLLEGENGNDRLFGFAGDDDSRGGGADDLVIDGAGNDRLTGGPGNDRVAGGEGGDFLDGGPGADRLEGGEGFDTVSYQTSSVGVVVRLDGVANDGGSEDGTGPAPTTAPRDDVDFSVERIVGTSFDDVLVGSPTDNTLVGDNGQDEFDGSFGRDTIEARDGIRDRAIRCGPGDDFARLDTQDVLDARSACERVDQSPLDDGPPGHALGSRLRRGRDGRVAVRVACPRKARTACRGVLTLRHPRSGRALARGRYRVALGRTRTMRLRTRGRLAGRVAVEMREQGVSKRGPRFSRRTLRVAR
jgi:hypothetical protein